MVIDGHVVNAAALLDVPGIDWAPLAELPEDVRALLIVVFLV